MYQKGINALERKKAAKAAFFALYKCQTMMESCIYPFERFERLKKWKGYSLAYSFGYSFKLLQKRNVLIGYSFGYSFLCLFCSNKTGKYLFLFGIHRFL